MSELSALQRAESFLARHGLERPSNGNYQARWAITLAHAAKSSDHWDAQRRAQLWLDAEGVQRTLKDRNPCIVMGVAETRTYYSINDRIDAQFGRFRPRCVTHGEVYASCEPDCVYGIWFDDKFVEEWIG